MNNAWNGYAYIAIDYHRYKTSVLYTLVKLGILDTKRGTYSGEPTIS